MSAHIAKRAKRTNPFWRFVGRFFAWLGTTLGVVLFLLLGAVYLICKGPSPTARNVFTITMEETSALKFVPRIFLSSDEVDAILNSNIVFEADTNTDVNIPFEDRNETIPKDTIEVIDIAGSNYAGKLMIVHDPSRISLATLPSFSSGRYGYTLVRFAQEHNAVAAINSGGFEDENGSGTGGMPIGIVIKDGQLVFGSPQTSGSIIGFDTNNHLVVGKMTAAECLQRNVRDAVSFGPALIVNGEPMEIVGSGGGINPRTVMGQRADGAVLLLVIDGRQAHSLGANYRDCIEVMLKYGAVNAANLDGGSSTAMYYNGEIINSCSALTGPRLSPSAFIVK